ncbi:TetR/AcrR family transcriptional regulator [Solibacillus sp. NPDC093137]|uniref:TetR/AcrR family transcriptional regulator n=1 Tax=Solibacillus sp. NPDC093137 TaxID=3390678 RepID=UPI003D0095F7
MLDKYMYLDKRVIKTKQQLKKALLSLLEQNNTSQITLKDIIKTANVSRGTFYNNYDSKEKLIKEFIDDIFLDLLHMLREPYKSRDELEFGNLKPFAINHLEYISEKSSIYTTIVNSDLLPTFHVKLIEVLKNHILKDVKITSSIINQELYGSFLAYSFSGLIIEWVKSDYKYTSNYMAEQLVEMMTVSKDQSIQKI